MPGFRSAGRVNGQARWCDPDWHSCIRLPNLFSLDGQFGFDFGSLGLKLLHLQHVRRVSDIVAADLENYGLRTDLIRCVFGIGVGEHKLHHIELSSSVLELSIPSIKLALQAARLTCLALLFGLQGHKRNYKYLKPCRVLKANLPCTCKQLMPYLTFMLLHSAWTNVSCSVFSCTACLRFATWEAPVSIVLIATPCHASSRSSASSHLRTCMATKSEHCAVASIHHSGMTGHQRTSHRPGMYCDSLLDISSLGVGSRCNIHYTKPYAQHVTIRCTMQHYLSLSILIC